MASDLKEFETKYFSNEYLRHNWDIISAGFVSTHMALLLIRSPVMVSLVLLQRPTATLTSIKTSNFVKLWPKAENVISGVI